MEVLVTGGNGFIGSHLADTLAKRGHAVTVFDLKFTSNTEGLDAHKVVGDIRDSEQVDKIVRNKNLLIHLAGISRVEVAQQDPRTCIEINLLGTVNLLEAAVSHNPGASFLFGSSREVYGNPVQLPVKEQDPKMPLSHYGIGKFAVEELLRAYHISTGLRYVIVRFSNVYGSSRDIPERVIPKFAALARRNEPITIYGSKILDFTFIDCVVDGIAKLVGGIEARSQEYSSNDFNFTSGVGTSLEELANVIKNALHSNSKILFEKSRSFEVAKFVGDPSKSNSIVGFKNDVSLEEGIKKYVERLRVLE